MLIAFHIGKAITFPAWIFLNINLNVHVFQLTSQEFDEPALLIQAIYSFLGLGDYDYKKYKLASRGCLLVKIKFIHPLDFTA